MTRSCMWHYKTSVILRRPPTGPATGRPEDKLRGSLEGRTNAGPLLFRAHQLQFRPRAGALAAAEMLGGQDLGDLHRVQRRALAQIVGDDPKVKRVRRGWIAADAADIDRVLAG